MNVQAHIKNHIASLPETKRDEIQTLHHLILQVAPESKLWFDDGKNEENRTVTNPTIGYGMHTIKYADGKTKDFFRVGISANQTGISIYIIGIKDKAHLALTYGERLGKQRSPTIVSNSKH